MADQYDYHYHFHEILGNITTIKSAISVIREDYQQETNSEITNILTILAEKTENLKTEIEGLRSKIYEITDPK